MNRKLRLASLQPQHPVQRAIDRCDGDAVKRNEHFLKYNLYSSTYDEHYAKAYGMEYLSHLEVEIRRHANEQLDLLLLPEVVFRPALIGGGLPPSKINPHFHTDATRLYTWSESVFCEYMGRVARELGIMIAFSLPVARSGKLYNAGMVIDRHGKLLANEYLKTHLAPGEEENHYAEGEGFTVIESEIGRLAFVICYDMQFPESVATCAALGAQIVLFPSNGLSLPDEESDLGLQRLRVRASDHHCAIVYSSFKPCAGRSPGSSAVISHTGQLLDHVEGDRSGIAIGEVELAPKRTYPRDTTDTPDRQAYRMQRRRTHTYTPLSLSTAS